MPAFKLKKILLLGGVVLVTIAYLLTDWLIAIPPNKKATYVGSKTCAECHQTEMKKWHGSDHDLAMDLATPEFVLGDFENTSLSHHGVTSKMSRKGDKYFVETEGPDGQHEKFEVKYVFGYRPLQQYLTELKKGRIQVLPVTWDTENKRWYYVSPDKPYGTDDPLHWTGTAQNWNHMCADCHSTNFKKGYDVKTDTYHSTFSEMDVSCEACHGPGSIHVEIAKSKSLFWDKNHGYGLVNLKDKNSQTELETCAPCHSRRQRFTDNFNPGDQYGNHFGLALLEERLYHPDGQINDEVYVYGSFQQSMMYRKGVKCTNCHDPHTTRLKFKGNKLCTQCHLAPKYDTPNHHFHKTGTKSASCVECHMPAKKYMVVDPRRDHSLRRPRPDLTVKIGTPNACNNCHTKKNETAQWAADKVVEWYGEKRQPDPHYGELFKAGRDGKEEVIDELIDLATNSKDNGPIVRATAVSLLATRYDESIKEQKSIEKLIARALKDRKSIVRLAALRYFIPPRPMVIQQAHIMAMLFDRLKDSALSVRIEAARIANMYPSQRLNNNQQIRLETTLKEYVNSLMVNADQSGVHMNLAILAERKNKIEEAIAEYRTAIRLDPSVVGPRSNLAALYSRLASNEKYPQRETAKKQARNWREEEEKLMTRDAKLLPKNGNIQFRLALIRHALGRSKEAVEPMKRAVELLPRQTDYRLYLAQLYEKLKQWDNAIEQVEILIKKNPNRPDYQQMLQSLQIQKKASN